MLKWRIAMVAVAAVAVAAAGCSDTTESTTTTAPDTTAQTEDVVFGQGAMPESIPSGFPVPAGSAIGATMVIKDGLTEVVMRVNAPPSVTAQFFDVELQNAGFAVDDVAEVETGWTIAFNDEGNKGTIDITEPLEGLSQAVVRFNVP